MGLLAATDVKVRDEVMGAGAERVVVVLSPS
jgi:hypothetical protein